MLTAEQIEQRKMGIGSSDAGAVLGVNPWRTPLDVYLDKIGESEPFEGNQATHFGHVLEEIVAQEYARRTEREVTDGGGTFVCEKAPFMMATPDRFTGSRRLLECKTAGQFVAHKWGESGVSIHNVEEADGVVPAEYVTQVTHQMLVCKRQEADLAVLIGGQDFRIYSFTLDTAFADILIDAETKFWKNHFEPRIPPPPSNLKDLDELFPVDDGSEVVANSNILAVVTDLKDIKTQMKDLTKREKDAKFAIGAYLGNSTVLKDADGVRLASYKHTTRKAYTVKESEYRQLRLS